MSKASPLGYLSTLKAWQLKQLAFLTGLNSTGTKAQLCRALTDSMIRPPLASPRCRILSVDMGVKNLAFCLLDLHEVPPDLEETYAQKTDSQLSLHLSDWKRLDVSERLVAKHGSVAANPSPVIEDQASEIKDVSSSGDQINLYAPSSLSKIAFGLASEFLQYKPDYVLIERQRFRSGGAPAIQEWTVRVNMLESMLWASLETMRHGYSQGEIAQGQKFPDLLEMSPRRVGMFWLAREDFFPTPADVATSLTSPKEVVQTTESELKKRSFEKKDKIALARHWLSLSMTTDDLTVDANLAPMVASFCSPKSRASRRKNKDDEHEEVDGADTSALSGKLDDLADCLVQAVTFALWEQNRTRVRDHVASQA
ncbi:ribonuclease H-like protein [Aureobasidium pullulans]|uniref:Ribonuclease H-like protein n=1 Tax=Aureobasidium pullulans TaxID=5580 RepID=A0A4S8S7K1_AURPU|nr:ribonuclease H-like protein [Aureobasidium pullulans]THZ78008.1 ribonuclease H-like protein [Aureobasidium pullulans]